jgi:putative transposase
VLVVMDQFARRLVGVSVHCDSVNGTDVCRTFNAAIHGQNTPRHLTTDHDPLFEAHRWKASSSAIHRAADADECGPSVDKVRAPR